MEKETRVQRRARVKAASRAGRKAHAERMLLEASNHKPKNPKRHPAYAESKRRQLEIFQ